MTLALVKTCCRLASYQPSRCVWSVMLRPNSTIRGSFGEVGVMEFGLYALISMHSPPNSVSNIVRHVVVVAVVVSSRSILTDVSRR